MGPVSERPQPRSRSPCSPHLRRKRAALAVDIAAIADEIARLTRDLESHDERAQTLAEAVSRIAHQLSHDDTNCPVCATPFKVGQLKALALANASVDTAPAAELGNALAAAKVRREDLTRQLAEVDRNLAEHAQLVTALTTEQAREANLVQELVEAGGAADAHYDDSAVIVLRANLNAVDRQISEAPSQDALDAGLADALAAIEAERVKRVSLERVLANASSDLEAARSLLTQHPELWTPGDGLLAPLAQEETAAQAEARVIGEQLQSHREALDAARVARDGLAAAIAGEDASLATINAVLDKLAETRRDIVRRWSQLGQTGDPDPTRVAQLRSQVAAWVFHASVGCFLISMPTSRMI